jgi:hypothetical protein
MRDSLGKQLFQIGYRSVGVGVRLKIGDETAFPGL